MKENFASQIICEEILRRRSQNEACRSVARVRPLYRKESRRDRPNRASPNPETQKYYKFRDDKFDDRGPFRVQPLATTSNDERPNLRYPIPYNGEEIWPEKQWQCEYTRTMAALSNDDLVIVKKSGRWSVNYKQDLKDESGTGRGVKPFSIHDGPYTQIGTAELVRLFGDSKVFPFPKPSELITRFILHVHPSKKLYCFRFLRGFRKNV